MVAKREVCHKAWQKSKSSEDKHALDVAKKEVYTAVMTAQESKLQEFTADLQSESGMKNCFRIAEMGFAEAERWALRKLGVDEWLIRTVMALYTEACTIVRTDAGLNESFEVKVGLHQGSVLTQQTVGKETIGFGLYFASVFPSSDILNGYVTNTEANDPVALSSHRNSHLYITFFQVL